MKKIVLALILMLMLSGMSFAQTAKMTATQIGNVHLGTDSSDQVKYNINFTSTSTVYDYTVDKITLYMDGVCLAIPLSQSTTLNFINGLNTCDATAYLNATCFAWPVCNVSGNVYGRRKNKATGAETTFIVSIAPTPITDRHTNKGDNNFTHSLNDVRVNNGIHTDPTMSIVVGVH